MSDRVLSLVELAADYEEYADVDAPRTPVVQDDLRLAAAFLRFEASMLDGLTRFGAPDPDLPL